MMQPIEMILAKDTGEEVEDVALSTIFEVDGKRYALLQIEEDVTFVRITFDEEGNTCFQDIKNDKEFKQVETKYKSIVS